MNQSKMSDINQNEAQNSGHSTPLMTQYFEIKEKYEGYLLFFRLGDFYELFFDDAIIAANELNIALTKRGKHQEVEIPMCGVPVHAHEAYLQKLIKAGHKVAICEQMEDPAEAKKRGAKSIVRRDVVRLITPGTLVEEDLLNARDHNYLLSFVEYKGRVGLSWVDISSGNLSTTNIPFDQAENYLMRLDPKEMLVSEKQIQNPDLFEFLRVFKPILSPQPPRRFDQSYAEKRLLSFYQVQAIDSFGQFSNLEIIALGSLIDYLDLTQKGNLPRLSKPRQIKPETYLDIDPSTRLNLELLKSLNGTKKGSLLETLDETQTSQGARLLAGFISNPLRTPAHINARLDCVSYFVAETATRISLREKLNNIADFERSLSRIVLNRFKPRDLGALKDALHHAMHIRDVLATLEKPDLLQKINQNLSNHDILLALLDTTLAHELPIHLKDGGLIQKGYDASLDECRLIRDESARLIANLQAEYIKQTNVNTLKIKHNNILGYFVEVTALQSDKLANAQFFHRQSLANVVRFSTKELSELEVKISKAGEQALGIEFEIIQMLVGKIQEEADIIANTSQSIALLDVLLNFAHLAQSRHWVKPIIDDSRMLDIKKGRHPIVEKALIAQKADPFVPNDCVLNQDEYIWLITGPNMAGKSTFLRQNALIVILAQMGCFVPASFAHIGIVDRLSSRIGASDDLARGRSTFMVEMVETAAILNQATPNSLVILDEVGRGTSTFDGLSIAWSSLEYLHNINKCRTLFATHYHELTQLSETLPALGCYTVNVKDWEDTIIFLHEVIKGSADRSYGIHVAQLAGLPKQAIDRAQQILGLLEGKEKLKEGDHMIDLPLFKEKLSLAKENVIPEQSVVNTILSNIVLDELTPIKAFDILVNLVGKVKEVA
ncbi:MAG: DNA mismatch repair protein MutS [Alphaproteobacteria bacterium]|nr:DNA mismatch repair protein MutS [Alphaproteobacteria bacterium]